MTTPDWVQKIYDEDDALMGGQRMSKEEWRNARHAREVREQREQQQRPEQTAEAWQKYIDRRITARLKNYTDKLLGPLLQEIGAAVGIAERDLDDLKKTEQWIILPGTSSLPLPAVQMANAPCTIASRNLRRRPVSCK